MTLTYAEAEKLIKVASASGSFGEDVYYSHAVDVSNRLLEDRRLLMTAADAALKRLPPHSPAAILLRCAIEEAFNSWAKKAQ